MSVRICRLLNKTIYINSQTKNEERGKKYNSLLREYFIIDRYFKNTKCIINKAINDKSKYSQNKYGFEKVDKNSEGKPVCFTRYSKCIHDDPRKSKTVPLSKKGLDVNGRLDLTDGDNIKRIFSHLKKTSYWIGKHAIVGGTKKRKMHKTRMKRTRRMKRTKRTKRTKRRC